MPNETYNKLSVGIKADPGDGSYLIGAEVGGGFVPFFRLSASRLQKYLDRADAEAKASKTKSGSSSSK